MTKAKHERLLWCETCDPQLKGAGEDISALKEHLKTVHCITGTITGKKEGLAFLDGDFFQNTYRWTINGDVKVIEIVSGPKHSL